MLAHLLRSSLGKPALPSLRGLAIGGHATSSATSLNFSRGYFMLGRSIVVSEARTSFVFGARALSNTVSLNEPAKSSKVGKPSSASPAKKSTTVKKGAAAKKAKPAKKGKTVKQKAVKKKQPKKKVVPKVPKIFKKDLKPPFAAPAMPFVKFAAEYYLKHKSTGPSNRMGDYMPKIVEEWKSLDQETKDSYKPSALDLATYRERRKLWFEKLEPRLQRAVKQHHKRKTPFDRPLSVFAQFVKENYANTVYPSHIQNNPEKMKYMSEIFRTMLTEADKEAINQRARQEYEAKQPETTTP